MPRGGSTAMLAGIGASQLQCALFVQMNFRSGPVYLWTGIGSITWNAQTWQGVGNLASLSIIEEGTTVEARGIVPGLSGIDATILADVMTEFQLGQPVLVYLGLFNSGALIASPFTSWSGRTDQPTVEVSGDKASIGINCELRLLDLNTAVRRRYTADDQARDFPGDLGFMFVNELQERTLYWGTAPTATGNI